MFGRDAFFNDEVDFRNRTLSCIVCTFTEEKEGEEEKEEE